LIVGAGELVFQFTRLVAGAGGFGVAIGLLKDMALEVWNRIGLVEDRGQLRRAAGHDLRRDAVVG